MTKFAALYDLHFGYERKNGHKTPLHDSRAISCALQYLKDFQPDTLILGGDILDCNPISHHNKGKPGRTEGFRLLQDAQECVKEIIKPIEALGCKKKVFIYGNHEDWLNDLTDVEPALSGLLDIRELLQLDSSWEIIPQGGYFNLGKLTFIHGDQLSGGEHVAKSAVTSYERSIRFGHFHSYQVYTKCSPIDVKLARTGIAVPCLCHKGPKYGESKPNRWVQGFLSGYVFPDGTFSDTVSIVTNGRLVGPNGTIYRA